MPLINMKIKQEEKDSAEEVLNKIGMTMSAYLRLSLKALVNEGGVPFAVTEDPPEVRRKVEYVKATMRLEGFELTPQEIKNVRDIISGERGVESVSREIQEKYKEE